MEMLSVCEQFLRCAKDPLLCECYCRYEYQWGFHCRRSAYTWVLVMFEHIAHRHIIVVRQHSHLTCRINAASLL